MEFDDARRIVLERLKTEGKAKNSRLIEALAGDEEVFRLVREDLIFEDLAIDKNGVGLVYTGPSSKPEDHAEPVSAAARHVGPHRIFISYGRADAKELAFQLERDLKSRGHTVWIDRREMVAAQSWEEQIEQAILGHDVFVCLLSPHAVRRPDGVCLDEISLARYNQRKIIPAMVMECRPPLGIFRLDWVDFQEWRNPARYENAIERLVAALAKESGVEGLHARIFSKLKPLDFGVEVSRHTRDFTGREWLFSEIDTWLDNDRSRVFLITGDPGSGKSAVMAQLVHRDPRVAAYHFCVASLEDSRSPVRFVKSLAAQLATQLEGYRAALEAVDLDQADDPEPGVLFRRLLADPLKAESPDRPVLLLVDALDEGFMDSGNSIPRILRDRLNDLPPWVRLVISSRKELKVLDYFSRFNPHEIDASQKENLDDVAAYLNRRFKEEELARLISSIGTDPRAVAELIARKGQGNFLYVVMVVEEIRAGSIDPRRADSFPDGLVDLYRRFFERVFPDEKEYSEFRPLLDVLCAAREPLTSDQLGGFLGRDPFDVRKHLERMAAFFPRKEGRYAVYHKSLLDWLIGTAGQSETYRVNIRAGHELIAKSCLLEYERGVSELSPYALPHLPAHLCGCEKWDNVETVLCDLRFIEAKIGAGMIYGLISDYRTALDALPEAQPEREKEREHEARVQKYIRDLIAYAKGEIAALEIIPSVRPWTEQETEIDSARIRNNPSRLDRICAFSQFVTSEAYALAEFAQMHRFLWQHAYNFADSGPVVTSAEKLVEIEHEALLLQRYPSTRPRYNPHPAVIKTVAGHTGGVHSVSATPDARRTASDSYDRSVRELGLGTGQFLKILMGLVGWVQSVSVTPDCKTAVSGGLDNMVRVWGLGKALLLKTLEGHTERVASVSVTPDGKTAVSGSSDRTVRVWDLDTGQRLKTLDGHSGGVVSVSVTPDGKTAVSGSSDRTVRVWDLDTGQCLKTLDGHSGGVVSVSVTSDGRRAVSGSDDNAVRVWDLKTGQCLKTLRGHTFQVTSVSVTPDGKTAVSGSGDSTVRVWDLDTGQCLKIMESHTGWVAGVCLTPDGKKAVSGNRDKTLRVWDLDTGQCLKTLHGYNGPSISVTPDGKRAVSGSDDNAVRVWDLETGQCLKTMESHTGWVDGVCLTPDGKKAVSGNRDKTLRVWDLDTGKCLKTLHGYNGPSISVTPDGKRAVSGNGDMTDLDSGQLIETVDGEARRGDRGSLTPDGRSAVSVNSDHKLRVWDLETGQCLKTLDAVTYRIQSVSATPDGKGAVSGSDEYYGGGIRVWDLHTGQCLNTLDGHRGGVESVRVSPDGKGAVSGSDDTTIRVWDLHTGQCLKTMESHAGWVDDVSLTPDGKRVVSGSRDGTLRVWDLDTGQCHGVYYAGGEVESISLLTGDRKLVCGVGGELVFIALRNFPMDIPIVTYGRIWLYGNGGRPGRWDREITAVCLWCGARFPARAEVLDVIRAINCNAGLARDQSPCLSLPAEAWDEPKLLSECPKCSGKLKFNPFIVDNRDRY